jgi:hypothetical protein
MECYAGEKIEFSIKKKISGSYVDNDNYIVALTIGGAIALKFKPNGSGDYLPIVAVNAQESKITIAETVSKTLQAGIYTLEIYDETLKVIGVSKNFLTVKDSSIKSEIV